MLLNLRGDDFAPGRASARASSPARCSALVALSELAAPLGARCRRRRRVPAGFGGYRARRHRALHRLRAARRDGVAAAARRDRRRADPRQAEDRLRVGHDSARARDRTLGDPVRHRRSSACATRRNLIVILMSIELMLNAVNLAFVGFNRLWPVGPRRAELDGQIFVLMVITVAAAEVAVGLGIVISLFRNRDSVEHRRREPAASGERRTARDERSRCAGSRCCRCSRRCSTASCSALVRRRTRARWS